MNKRLAAHSGLITLLLLGCGSDELSDDAILALDTTEVGELASALSAADEARDRFWSGQPLIAGQASALPRFDLDANLSGDATGVRMKLFGDTVCSLTRPGQGLQSRNCNSDSGVAGLRLRCRSNASTAYRCKLDLLNGAGAVASSLVDLTEVDFANEDEDGPVWVPRDPDPVPEDDEAGNCPGGTTPCGGGCCSQFERCGNGKCWSEEDDDDDEAEEFQDIWGS